MEHGKVLKRAWEILWRYRVLWVFGIIVALTAAGGGASYGGGRGGGDGRDPYCEGVGMRINGECVPWEELPERLRLPDMVPQIIESWSAVATVLIAIGVTVACLMVVLTVIKVIALYVAETALIELVDDYEETGEKRGVREGIRLGWSRTALRLFVIDLITKVPGVITAFALVLLGLVVFAMVALTKGNVFVSVTSVVAAIGLAFLLILVAILVGLGISLLRPFLWRVCALEKVGVIESLQEGFGFVRRHLSDAAIMWLIMIGLHLAWGIVMIPVVILLIIVGSLVAGLPALMVILLVSQVFSGAVPWIAGLSVALPIFILVLAAPLTFLGGLAAVFKSSVWTLTYRELRALEGLRSDSGPSPEPETSVAG